MKLGSFRLGMRTFKTGLAVMIIVAIFVLIDRGNPMIAALSAVFSLRQDFETTVEFGKSCLANALGGGFAIAYFLIYEYFNEASLVQILVLPTFLMLLISINDGIGNNKGNHWINSGFADALTIQQMRRICTPWNVCLIRSFIGTAMPS